MKVASSYESLTGSRDLPIMSRSNSVAVISPSNLALSGSRYGVPVRSGPRRLLETVFEIVG
jgi:hypothetical protein